MTYEEYLKKRLDRLNENSYYGIMPDIEITKIVRSHIKRLEENKMKATSVQKIENVREMHFTIEKACTDEISKVIVGAETNDDLFEFHFSGVGCDVFADQWFNAVADKPFQEENEKLKKQLNAVTLILDNFRKDHEDILKTQREKHKDEVKQLKQHLKQVEDDKERLMNRYNALSSNYEKEISKVEKLEKDLDKKNTAFKFAQKSADYWADKARALEKSFTFEKAANEAQHRFIREYAGKDTEVEFNYVVNESENEVSYVIVDKEEKEKIYRDEIVALIHGVKYTVEGLVDRILDLEKLKTPTIENFADDEEDNKMEPTSVWKIENIDDIWISQEGDKMSLQLKNRDDITKIILTGDAIKNHNEQFVTVLKTDMEENEKTICERDQENENLKKAYNILNAALTKSQRDCNKWYKRCLKMLSEEDSYKKDHEEPSSRRDILRCAEKCVCGQREHDYGTPESNFQLIADLWNDYLGLAENGDGEPIFSIKSITSMDVSMMMALLKIARIKNGGGSGDSFVDLAGYAACGGEIWHEQKVKDQN